MHPVQRCRQPRCPWTSSQHAVCHVGTDSLGTEPLDPKKEWSPRAHSLFRPNRGGHKQLAHCVESGQGDFLTAQHEKNEVRPQAEQEVQARVRAHMWMTLFCCDLGLGTPRWTHLLKHDRLYATSGGLRIFQEWQHRKHKAVGATGANPSCHVKDSTWLEHTVNGPSGTQQVGSDTHKCVRAHPQMWCGM